MTEDPKIYNEEIRASSIDSAGKTGYHIIKRIKYFGINLTKVKHLYTENNNALWKGIEDDRKMKNIICS